jgi:hypothetical protein
VQFFYVYKALAHPQKDGYVEPIDLAERLLHVKEAKRRLDTKMPWLCDSASNELKHAFGDRPNSEFVIGADGKIVAARGWSDPQALRDDLGKLIGPVERPTTLADLGREPQPAPKLAPRGVVPPIERPAGLVVLKAKPKPKLASGDKPSAHYVKLRAEAQSEVLAGGSGKLVIGFHLDPIYHVHWNNLAAPLKFSIKTPDGTEVTPSSGAGPQLEQESDSDPREFVIDLKNADPKKPLVLSVDYFACNDEEGWCKAVSQQYEITLARDPDAGRVMGGRGGQRGAGGRRPQRGGGADQMIARIFESDADGDGKLSRSEAPERMVKRFDQMDTDGDGFVEKAELEARFGRRR